MLLWRIDPLLNIQKSRSKSILNGWEPAVYHNVACMLMTSWSWSGFPENKIGAASALILQSRISSCMQAKEEADMEAMIQAANATPKGAKKAYGSIENMPKGYQPRFVEAATWDNHPPPPPLSLWALPRFCIIMRAPILPEWDAQMNNLRRLTSWSCV